MRLSSRLLCLAAASAALLAPPLLAQSYRDDPVPTILERRDEQRTKNPALEEKLATAAQTMRQLAWMAGKWDVTERTFGTRSTPESTVRGTREVAFELDGRSLLARQATGSLKTLEILVYDPYRGNWFLQILTNGGRSVVEPLVSRSGWDAGTLQLEGRLWLYGLNAEVSLRIVREGDDAYREVIEEKLAGGIYRPVFEFRYTRPAAAAPKKSRP